MKRDGGVVVRKVRSDGTSLVVSLAPAVRAALRATAGALLVEVVTPDGTVELQPLTPPTRVAAERRRAAETLRTLRRACARLRAKRGAAYQAGYQAGFDKGVMWAMQSRFLDLDRVLPKLERALDTGALLLARHTRETAAVALAVLNSDAVGGAGHVLPAAPTREPVVRHRRGR